MRILGSLFFAGGLLFAVAELHKASIIPIGNGPSGTLVIAIIFIVIGLICIAAGGTRKVQIIQGGALPIQTTKPVESKTCPACAEEVKKEAKICRFCNHSFVLGGNHLPPAENNDYYYQLIGCIKQGPVGSDVIIKMIQSNQLNPEDQVLIPDQGWHNVSEIKL